MGTGGWNISLEDADKIHSRLKTLLENLKPHSQTDLDYYFFEVIRELVIATITHYSHFRRGYTTTDNQLLSWGCRNLLELRVFTKYALLSGENALTFGADRLVDAQDIAVSLIELEHFHDPNSETRVLDEWLSAINAQLRSEAMNFEARLRASDIAKKMGLNEEYKALNKVCSKLVHPTGWSIIAMKVGANDFPAIREVIFGCGVGYLSQIFMEIHDHNARQGMKPNPQP